jgi:hypothetical protein
LDDLISLPSLAVSRYKTSLAFSVDINQAKRIQRSIGEAVNEKNIGGRFGQVIQGMIST